MVFQFKAIAANFLLVYRTKASWQPYSLPTNNLLITDATTYCDVFAKQIINAVLISLWNSDYSCLQDFRTNQDIRIEFECEMEYVIPILSQQATNNLNVAGT